MFARVCEGGGLSAETLPDLHAAADAVRENALDVLVLVEEAIARPDLAHLERVLHAQPTWSDLPLVVLARGSEEETPVRARYEALGNVTLLGRPVRVFSLVSTLRACLRARARQREAGSLLERHRQDLTALAESEARYRAVGESIAYGVWVSDADGRPSYLSESFLQLLGTTLDEVRRTGWTHLLAPDEARRVEDAHAAARAVGGPVDVEFRVADHVVLTRGSPLPSDNGRPSSWVGMHLDVTDRRRMEDELARIDRLSSVSVLAGGIAHDFNNVLGAVLANANLAKRQMERGDPRAPERIEKIETAVRHAKYIVGQLLGFARGTAPLRSSLRLSDVLRDASAFAVQGSACALEVEIPGDLWAVSADGGQIGQVVHNLTLNAVQAQEGGGRVRLHATNIELSVGDVPPVPPGRYVRVTVADDGPGIPPELVPRVFDPFVSTKSGGHGLGLATAFTVVRRHGGHLKLVTALGQGCSFCFFLPATSGEEHAEPPPVGEVRGDERVLVMDDDAQIRDVVYAGLTELGYRVVCAEHGEAALEMWGSAREAGDPFDVVVLDLTVPGGLGGLETLQRMAAQDPRVRAIVASGYSSAPVIAEHRQHGFSAALPKPYGVADLASKVRAVVTGDGPGGNR